MFVFRRCSSSRRWIVLESRNSFVLRQQRTRNNCDISFDAPSHFIMACLDENFVIKTFSEPAADIHFVKH